MAAVDVSAVYGAFDYALQLLVLQWGVVELVDFAHLLLDLVGAYLAEVG